MSSLLDMSLSDFNNILASNEPAPGGGSTAALSGVLGSALTMMVVNLSIGKKSFEALDEQTKERFLSDYEEIKTLNKQLVELIDEDTIAFNLYMKAIKMPKETEKTRRSESMQKASLYALKVPLSIAEKCLHILKHQLTIVQHGNKNAVSDVGVGALLAHSGLEGAALNVKINLPGIKDESVKADAMRKLKGYTEEGEKLRAEIINIVNQRINKL